MSEDMPLQGGLLAGESPIPLEGVRITGTVEDCVARVVVAQRYLNREPQPIEAVYVFPLDERAAVCGFEAVVGDRHVVAEVKERDEAFDEYDDALDAGHAAYLLDEERADIFTASLGNVAPGQEVLIQITYVTELDASSDVVRFVLPTTVAPRYAPAEDRVGVGRSPAEAVNPPVAWRVPYGLEIELDLAMPTRIRSVESPSHPVTLEVDGAHAHVRLGERSAALDRDFVLAVKLATPLDTPWLRLQRDDAGRTAAMLVFTPTFAAAARCNSEVVFLVDRSGSMNGASIDEARAALQLCLGCLQPGMRFNVVGFGSRCETLFPASRAYDDASLGEATRHVEQMRADLGGTEILPALEAVFAMERVPGLPRQLVVLTDGEVSNSDAVIALVRRHSDDTRVFAFGIGAGASRHLVRGIARAGEGAAEFVAPGERIDDKVSRHFRKLLAPAVSGVELDWGTLSVRQAPHLVPPVYDGERLIVYGLIDGGTACDVVLRGRGTSGWFRLAVRVDPAQAAPGRLVGTLAARALIRDLEEGMSPLHDRHGSLQERRHGDSVKDRIVRLALEFGLASRETSFVAVDRRAAPLEGDARLRRVPVALTRGWGGLDEPGHHDATLSCKFEDLAPDAPDDEDLARLYESARALLTSALEPILELQTADGCWELTDDLLAALGADADFVRADMARYEEEKPWLRAQLTAVVARFRDVVRMRQECLIDAAEALEEPRSRGGPLPAAWQEAGLRLPEFLAGVRALAADTRRLHGRLGDAAPRLLALAEELDRLAAEAELVIHRLTRIARLAEPRAVATSLVLEWLYAEAIISRHRWEVPAEKAERWLERAPELWLDTVH